MAGGNHGSAFTRPAEVAESMDLRARWLAGTIQTSKAHPPSASPVRGLRTALLASRGKLSARITAQALKAMADHAFLGGTEPPPDFAPTRKLEEATQAAATIGVLDHILLTLSPPPEALTTETILGQLYARRALARAAISAGAIPAVARGPLEVLWGNFQSEAFSWLDRQRDLNKIGQDLGAQNGPAQPE